MNSQTAEEILQETEQLASQCQQIWNDTQQALQQSDATEQKLTAALGAPRHIFMQRYRTEIDELSSEEEFKANREVETMLADTAPEPALEKPFIVNNPI